MGQESEGDGIGREVVEPRQVKRRDLLYPKESFEIKAACIAVHEQLGSGFLEKVYENALTHELCKRGFRVTQQATLDVFYDGMQVGQYFADLLIDDRFIVEIKASEHDHPVYEAQLINYLKATGLQLGFLVNFGKEFFTFKRIVFTKK